MTTSPDLEALKDLVELAKKAGAHEWAVDGDDRPGMEWNNFIVQADARHMTVCFMAHAEGDNSELEAAAEFIAAAKNAIPALERLLASQGKPEAEGVADPSEISTLAEMRKLFDVPDAPVAPPSDKLRGLVRKWRETADDLDRHGYDGGREGTEELVSSNIRILADDLEALLSQEPSSGAPVTADVEPASLGAAILTAAKEIEENMHGYSPNQTVIDAIVEIISKHLQHQPIKAGGK